MRRELAEFRYLVYGGNARNFMFSKHVRSRVFPVVEDTMNLVFRYANLSDMYPYEWSNTARHISSRLTSSASPSSLNSMLRHLLPNREKIWASKFMELLAGAISDTNGNPLPRPEALWVHRNLVRVTDCQPADMPYGNRLVHYNPTVREKYKVDSNGDEQLQQRVRGTDSGSC
jgi:hypothetical protein